MSWLNKIFYFLFPFLEVKKAEKTINDKIEKIKNDKQKDIGKVDTNLLKEIYNDTLEVKKNIDDKSKIGIVGVTILIGLIPLISSNYENIAIISIVLYIASLIHSLIAGSLSLQELGSKNIIYKLSVNNLLLETDEKNEALIINSKLNIEENINRQNYVYSIFRHLTYSIVLMVFAFLSNLYFFDGIKNKKEVIHIEMNITQIYVPTKKLFLLPNSSLLMHIKE